MAFVPCPVIFPSDPQPPGVTVPGFGRIQAVKAQVDGAPRPYDLAATLLAQVNPVLAPFNFVLQIVEAIFSIFKALKSVTNPFKLVKQLRKLSKILSLIATFAPNVAWVRMTRDILDICVSILNGFVAIIQAWVRDINSLRNAFVVRDNLPEDPEIIDLIRCTKGLFTVNIQGVNDSLAAFATALGFVGQLLELLSSFAPGGAAKNLANAVSKVATLPAQFAALDAAVAAAENIAELDEILVTMQELALTIGDVAGVLATVSQSITNIVGE